MLISAFYVYDWAAKKGLIADQAGFLAAVQSKNVDTISQFFQDAGLVYNPVSGEISKSTGATSEYKIGNIEGVFVDNDQTPPTFESLAIYLLSGNKHLGAFVSLLGTYFGRDIYLKTLVTNLRKSNTGKVLAFQFGGKKLNKNGGIINDRVALNCYTCPMPSKLAANGLLSKFLDYLINNNIITIEDQVNQTAIRNQQSLPASAERDTETFLVIPAKRCYSLKKISKKIFRKRLHITLFVIASAALLAGGAVALTTYFHVGTTLMLTAGFIPFLNFVGGFQISLLLGVVVVATASAGIGVFIKKNPEYCSNKCRYSLPEQDLGEKAPIRIQQWFV
jgi:hypothetical protein